MYSILSLLFYRTKDVHISAFSCFPSPPLHAIIHFAVLCFLGVFCPFLKESPLCLSMKTKPDSVSWKPSARPLDLLIALRLLDAENISTFFPFLNYLLKVQHSDYRNHPSILRRSFIRIFSVPEHSQKENGNACMV